MTGKNIEVEVRALISASKYNNLLNFFKRNAKLVSDENEITHYLNKDGSLRLRKTDSYSMVYFKDFSQGSRHESVHQESELAFASKDFEKAKELFSKIGFELSMTWIRHRKTFLWKGISAMLDYTRGYGYIIELEKMSNPSEKEKALALLNNKLNELGVKKTPKTVFDKKYQHYHRNWKKLVS